MKTITRDSWLPVTRKALSARKIYSRILDWLRLNPSISVCIALSGAWLLMVLLANPAGEFPLNDDWSYSYAVKSLVERHHLELSGFTSMPLITQVLWGALFCLPFGFSFTALRISTIVLGLFGILLTFRLLDEIISDHKVALLGTAIVAANPLYFQLSLTFMTDIPFYTFSMAAFLFLFRAFRTGYYLDLGIGYAFVFLAILTRQLAIVIPFAFLIAFLIKNRAVSKSLVITGLPAAMFTALLLLYPPLLRRTIGLPALYNRSFEPILEAAVKGPLQIPLIFLDRLFIQLVYLGLFTLPFLIMFKAHIGLARSERTYRLMVSTWVVLFLGVTGVMLLQGRIMPLVGNVLFDFGLGPPVLRDTYTLGLPHLPVASKGFWIAVTVISVAGASLLLGYFGKITAHVFGLFDNSREVDRPAIIFFLSSAFLYCASIGIAGYLDWYLIWLLPLLPACLLLAWRESIHFASIFLLRAIALALLSFFGIFAVTGTHDYLTSNRTRWQALEDFMKKKDISFQNMDGGFEFNGWYGYNANYRPHAPKSWWWVKDDQYLISFGPVAGYEEIGRYPFKRWIPPSVGNIMVLQRVGTPMNDQEIPR